MSSAWLNNSPHNAKHRVNIDRYSSLLELFHQTTEKYHEQTAYSNFGVTLKYSEIASLSSHFAAYLQNELNISQGDRVALMCPNTLCFPVAMWALMRLGAVQVNVNPMYTSRELQHQLSDAQADTIIIFSSAIPTLAEIIVNTPIKHIITIELDDLVNKGLPCSVIDKRLPHTVRFSTALVAGKNLQLIEPTLCHKDLAFLQYTGGTTGLSKGAMLTHGNLIANIMQYQQVAKNLIRYGNEVVITAIPMYHIFALMANTLSYFYFGAQNVLVTDPRDLPSFVRLWKNTPATFFTGVNTLYNGLLHTPGFDEIDFSSLKLCIGGGAAVQQAVADKWQKVTGVRLFEGYGLSETSPVLTLNLGTKNHYIPGIGKPIPNTDICIRDDNNRPVAQGQKGELCAKGPQVMSGYWNNKQASHEAFTSDGYFKTGDIALLDQQGFFHIVDRKKDMINVSGFNVFPNEVEAVAAKIPGLLESACIGVKDDKTGEAVKLFVVKGNSSVTEQHIMDFCQQNLTAYKRPKHIEFIDEIPKSTVGKLLRRALR